ncbi:Cobyric acid synthase [Azospirillaceae bacterium]
MSAAVMFQGTGSDVGKSLIVAGLCRVYRRRGLSVLPFKPQNMSNNAAVTADGGEIGRAQALQARACGVAPTVDMNPVLLKPQSDIGAQVVVQGRVLTVAKAIEYQSLKPTLLSSVCESYQKLRSMADLVLIEGAGSAAEINLRGGDIANMGFAEAVNAPVILIGDIDRGGVIAGIVGTHVILSESDRNRLCGFIINKFRGDPRLFDEGLKAITAFTGLPSLGMAPFFPAASRLPAEDAASISGALKRGDASRGGETLRPIRVIVPWWPHIANFDDLDPLRLEPDVSVEFVYEGQALPQDADALILPGSKATISDLLFFRRQGWDIDLMAFLRQGKRVLGVCGGFQMLGRMIDDSLGGEGPPRLLPGLGILDIETTLSGEKTLVQTNAVHLESGQQVCGYEMHVGVSRGPAMARPMFRIGDRSEGATSENGRISGTYLHGLFAADGFRHAFLNGLRARESSRLVFEQDIEASLDALADHLEAHLDVDHILRIAWGTGRLENF